MANGNSRINKLLLLAVLLPSLICMSLGCEQEKRAPAPASAPAPGPAPAPEPAPAPNGGVLNVTDRTGKTIHIKDACIDYTVLSYMYRNDEECRGFRVKIGDGATTVPWAKMARIEITSHTEGALSASMRLKDGSTEQVKLAPAANDKGLYGDTNLGRIRLRLDKIKTIEVLGGQ